MPDEPRYVSKPLEADQIDLGYPLIREIAEGLSIEGWRRYAAQFVAPGGPARSDRGIVVVEARRNYFRALFVFRVVPCLDSGRRFAVDCLAAPDAIDRRSVVNHLIETLHLYARRHRCAIIDAKLVHGNAWIADLLRRTGYREEFSPVFRLSGGAPGMNRTYVKSSR